MPKQVDHDAYRREIAARAAPVFRKHGYSGLGMRQIAREIGISKGALYHYFSGKEELFAACTRHVVKKQGAWLKDASISDEAAIEERVDALMKLLRTMEPDFEGELSLLIDYLRDMEPAEIASDANMQLANRRSRELVARIVGDEHATPVLCLFLGVMLQRHLDGRQTDVEEIARWLTLALQAMEKDV